MPSTSLSQRLREDTIGAHTQAEESTFMVDLLAGRLTVGDFAALQEQSLLFYTALEKSTDLLQDHAAVAAITDDRLVRAPRLRADLRTLGRSAAPGARPATAAYVAELERIGTERDCSALVAHHYVRYLGDLSGGQIIAQRMRQHYQLPDDALSFYRFPGIDKPKVYKDAYRRAIDSMQLSATAADAVVEHARAAFAFNHRVFRDLELITDGRDGTAA